MQAKEEELLSTKFSVFSLSFRPKVASFRPAEMKDEDENGNNQSMRTTKNGANVPMDGVLSTNSYVRGYTRGRKTI